MSEQLKNISERIELPAAFIKEMKELFQTLSGVSVSELPTFLESLQEERSCGLRRNPLKYTGEEFEEKMPFTLERIPWAEEGYFYQREELPGKSPFHEAGAFYIQEPSAMIAVRLLGAEPGEYIADLCAAPGGKSTQIAGRMQGEGLLVCNEYVPARAEILAQNMERMGVQNCVILKESVDRMAERFPLFFDRVVVDAPCSGSGMFRKEEQALIQWSPENVGMCAERQREILEYAAGMVKPGGVLVYSTCSFSKEEDEAVVEWFLEEHREFSLDETALSKELLEAGVCPGGLPGTVRMWPHKLRGEGHFAARLVKEGGETEAFGGGREQGRTIKGKGAGEKNSEQDNRNYFQEFCRQYLRESYLVKLEGNGRLIWRKEHLFWIPKHLPETGNLRMQRSGLYLGEAKKGRFEPSHTWAMTLKKEDVAQWMEVKLPEVYLRGETLENEGLKGWVLMLLQGKPLGWGKAGGNMVKNHYPKGLRKMHFTDRHYAG